MSALVFFSLSFCFMMSRGFTLIRLIVIYIDDLTFFLKLLFTIQIVALPVVSS